MPFQWLNLSEKLHINPSWFLQKKTQLSLLLKWNHLDHPIVAHILSIFIYIIVSLVFSWPTIQNFTTRVVGISVDTFFTMWFNWFFKEVLSGKLSLDPVMVLFYPKGVPLGVMGIGPLMGFFGIPFWGMGSYAIYNGAYLTAMVATGYCMFLLARSLGLTKISSIFAGIALEISPLVLYGLFGHSIKSFQGNLALYLLFLNQLAVDRAHVKRNIIFGSLSMLLCLLHDANYFIFAIITTGLFVVVKLIQGDIVNRIMFLKRLVMLTLISVVLCSPYLYNLFKAYQNSSFNVKMAGSAAVSADYSVDLAAYFLPNNYNSLFGQFTKNLVDKFPNFTPAVGVTIPLTLMVLTIIGLFKYQKKHLIFYLVFITFFLLAMGPYPRFLGEFIEINGSRIPLPFYFMAKIPGFDFMRVPSRFMMMGYVGLGITAAIGLNFLIQKFNKAKYLLGVLFLAGLVIESWWIPFPSMELPDTPEYYVELEKNTESFGVFDLPMNLPGVNFSSYEYGSYTSEAYINYMLFQMSHHKGIAAGLFGRPYLNYPIIEEMDSKHPGLFSSPELTLEGSHPAKFTNLQYELGRQNYRKVVWHKELYGEKYCKKPDSIAFVIGHKACYEAVENQKKEMAIFLEQAFGSQLAEYDDSNTVVYNVQMKKDSDLIPNLQYDANWPKKENGLQPFPQSAGIITEFPEDVNLKLMITLKSKNESQINGVGKIRFLMNGIVIGESEILSTLELDLRIPKGMNKLIVEMTPSSNELISVTNELIVQEMKFSYLKK